MDHATPTGADTTVAPGLDTARLNRRSPQPLAKRSAAPPDAVVACVLCGGSGSRLWPLSRRDRPKQFQTLTGGKSMLAKTLDRMRAGGEADTTIVVIGAAEHEKALLEAVEPHEPSTCQVILEPMPKNTAASVAIAARHALGDGDSDPLMLVVPADHEIGPDNLFWETVADGMDAARDGKLVVFGVRPTRPETGYGYIQIERKANQQSPNFLRFVEKPDEAKAAAFVADGNYLWNAGIILCRASAIRDAFERLQPAIWKRVGKAYETAAKRGRSTLLPQNVFATIPPISVDHGVLEHFADIAVVEARFQWSDVGSWEALFTLGDPDANGNVVIGDVVSHDCHSSYIRSDGRLVATIGLEGITVVSTADATLVAKTSRVQEVRLIAERLEQQARAELRSPPQIGLEPASPRMRLRCRRWLTDEALPFWGRHGVDHVHGGFHEAVGLDGTPIMKPKRMRTMARQVYSFAVAARRGWYPDARELVAHGLDFLRSHGRRADGGWVKLLDPAGAVLDGAGDAYDQACMLLALAHAHRCGFAEARDLADETMAYVDGVLADRRSGGFHEDDAGTLPRRANPHMHLLEAFLAWHKATGETCWLERASAIGDLFNHHFFDSETWTVGEYYDAAWRPMPGQQGDWTEPGHHFEWSALLCELAACSDWKDQSRAAYKIYCSALASGTNRLTGLAFGAVSRNGKALDRISRSWPQAEAVKAAIALDQADELQLAREVEERMERIFRTHLSPAKSGLWLDRIAEDGTPVATEVPASILYHLVTAFNRYLEYRSTAADTNRPASA